MMSPEPSLHTSPSPESADEKRWVSPGAAMKTLGICRSTLINYRKAGLIEALPPLKLNGHWRYNVDGFVQRSLKRT
ncbi:MAG: helix-turn-helix domain-containing protein [Hyphomicrobiaceae bacterium]